MTLRLTIVPDEEIPALGDAVIRFETINGSVYLLDEPAATWTREHRGRVVDPLNPLRGESGPMLGHSPIIVGRSAIIYAPPLDSRVDYRQITTSSVARILDASNLN